MKDIFKTIRYDLPAGLVVFFVAVPLCLGIALASGAPLFSGIIAGIVGGILVGAASGSALGVSGPAAGLAVIVFTSLAQLGGSWESFLLAVVIAGVFQLIAGFLKAGTIAYYFPSSVIKGMLSAIGILIILKQIPHLLGYDADYEGDMAFEQPDKQNTFSEILNSMQYTSAGAIVISVISLAILIVWEKVLITKHRIFMLLQGPLVAVIAGILLNIVFSSRFPYLSLGEEHVVSLPVARSIGDFFSFFTFPDFTQLGNPRIYSIALLIAVVASIETLLSVEAADKLDPQKRVTPVNRELKAQGLGNIISGLIGGLPVTQVIVRSSTNIAFGGKTKMAAIIHGVLLLLSIVTIASLMNKIPMATLACILLLVGYKLTKPSLFREMYKLGWEQFIPFMVTIIGIIFTDLLIGIGIGLGAAIVFILSHHIRNPFHIVQNEFDKVQGFYKVNFSEEVSFLNRGKIMEILGSFPPDSKVVVNASRSRNIHYDVLEIIRDFQISAKARNIKVEVVGSLLTINLTLEGNLPAVQLRNIKEMVSPLQALNLLKEGNNRFVQNLKRDRDYLTQVNETSEEQHPFAAVLSCIDSRTSAELIFDQGLGDIFSIRIAGNILNKDILGSMEFATKIAGAKLIMVLGHSNCGAIKGACSGVRLGNLNGILDKIKPSIEKLKKFKPDEAFVDINFIESVAAENVLNTMAEIIENSPVIKELVKKGEVVLAGGMYDISTGIVEFYDRKTITEHRFNYSGKDLIN